MVSNGIGVGTWMSTTTLPVGVLNAGVANEIAYYTAVNTLNGSSGFVLNGTNVGIGSLSPGQLLDVQGTVRTIGFTMSGQTPISGYVLTSQDSSGDATWSSPGAVGGWTVSGNNVYETSGGNVGIGTTLLTTAALTVMNGNVGIGTWIPKEALDVEGTFSIAFFNGNVGIGTYGSVGASPGSGLNILQGNANANVGDNFENTNSTGYEGINLYDNTGTLAASFQYGNATATVPSLFIGNREAGNMNIVMGSTPTTRDIFTNGGNLGIGTQTSNQLDVNGGVSIGTAYNAYTQTTAPAGGLIVSGNVGIGSLTPGYLLDIQGTIRGLGEIVNGNVGIGTTNASAALSIMNGNVGIGTWNPRATLDVEGTLSTVSFAGNVGIGTLVASNLLSVNGNILAAGSIFANPNGSTQTPAAPRLFGFSPAFSAGQAAQVQFGDQSNTLQNGYGARMQLSAYWGIEIRGNDETTAPAFATGTAADSSLAVFAPSTATANIIALENNGGTKTYDAFGPTGNLGIGTSSTQGGLVVTNGNVGIGTFAPTNGFVYNNCAAHSGQAACWAANGAAGYCTTVVSAAGACTCTAC
jgi:hypothetical protein